MATYVIGDVHAQYNAMRCMLDKMDLEKDTIIFLGDYVDFGDRNFDTLKYLMRLTREHKNIRCLIGNHDRMMADNLTSIGRQVATLTGQSVWSNNGGTETLNEIFRHGHDEMSKISKWVESLGYYEEIEVNGSKYYLAHAYTYDISTNEEKAKRNTVWRRIKALENPFKYMGDKYKECKLICGHTISRNFTHGSFEAYFDERFIAIDCGAKVLDRYPGEAKLGAIRLDDMKCIYVDIVEANNWYYDNILT